MQKIIQAEEELLREYKTVRADLVKKYGSVENLKAQAVKDLPDETQYGMVSDAINDYRNLIAYEQELGNARYISTNIKPIATREGVIVENVSKPTKQQPTSKVKPQASQEVIEQPTQQVDEVVESVPQQTEQPKINLNTLKSNIRANKFEQGNLKDYMVVGKGKKGYKSNIADPISYDIENSQRDFNKIITEISKNPEKLNDKAY